MIKDIVVNLTGGHPQDFASDYAISLAAGFRAHIAGVAFIYEPVVPGSVLGGIPTDLIEAQRSRNTVAAREAIARFESTAKAAGVSAEARTLDASLAGAPDLFGRITRRFDIAVVGQARHEQGASETGADFMVLGGYGHSRLREFILGGVTRSILRSMTVPVLMSH